MSDFEIIIVDDEACPRCGAFASHPDEALRFPNRPKVDNYWKCYNPACEVGYYDPDSDFIELKPSDEEAAEMVARIKADVARAMEGKTFVKTSPEGAAIETWELR